MFKVIVVVALIAALIVVLYFLSISFKLLRQTEKQQAKEKLLNPQYGREQNTKKLPPK